MRNPVDPQFVSEVEPRASAPPSRPQELRPGEEVVLSGQAFAVTELLGRGSFGEVWGARGADGARIAIKEMSAASGGGSSGEVL